MHNSRKAMALVLNKLRSCLESNNDQDSIKMKLWKVLEIEHKRPGALPGSSLKEIKSALEILNKRNDLKRVKETIKRAKNSLEKDKMMQKRKSKF